MLPPAHLPRSGGLRNSRPGMRYWPHGSPMHTRRLTTLLLGLWLGASILMDWIAMDSFSVVDDSFQSARDREPAMVKSIGVDPVKALLRYQTAELNRHHLYLWGYVQSVFGIVLVV